MMVEEEAREIQETKTTWSTIVDREDGEGHVQGLERDI